MKPLEIATPAGHKPAASSKLAKAPETTPRIAVFADGANVDEMLDLHRRRVVQGFTTNPTLMRQSGVVDYVSFASAVLAEIRDVPISFEVFADEFGEMERQGRANAS